MKPTCLGALLLNLDPNPGRRIWVCCWVCFWGKFCFEVLGWLAGWLVVPSRRSHAAFVLSGLALVRFVGACLLFWSASALARCCSDSALQCHGLAVVLRWRRLRFSGECFGIALARLALRWRCLGVSFALLKAVFMSSFHPCPSGPDIMLNQRC